MSKDFRAVLDLFLDEYGQTEHYNGVVRITHHDDVIYHRNVGYADCENRLEFTKDSIFNLYSITKAFCAIGFMKLVDRGAVDLDKHPGVYLPEASDFDSRVTLRHILQHTSGLPDFAQDTDMRTKRPGATSAQLRSYLKELAAYPMHFDPGTGGHYANINYMIPAFIIEELTGELFADYLKKEVLDPLGATTAKVLLKGDEVPNRVKGYDLRDGEVVHVLPSDDWMYGAGDLVGTVDDVYTLNHAVKHRMLLSESSWQQVLTPSPHNYKGFGCTITKFGQKDRITHNGGARGFRTLHIHIPEDDFDIIALSNSGWGDSRAHISNAIFDVCYGEDREPQVDIEMDKGYI